MNQAIIFWGLFFANIGGVVLGLASPLRWGRWGLAFSALILGLAYAFIIPTFTRVFIDMHAPMQLAQKLTWPPANWLWAIVCLVIGFVSISNRGKWNHGFVIRGFSLVILALQVLWFISLSLHVGMAPLVQ